MNKENKIAELKANRAIAVFQARIRIRGVLSLCKEVRSFTEKAAKLEKEIKELEEGIQCESHTRNMS